VAVAGDTAVIGARFDDGGSNSGSAYVFTRTGNSWSGQAKLTAGDAAAGDYFGISVAVAGDTAVIGAFADDSGSAYMFDLQSFDYEFSDAAYAAIEGSNNNTNEVVTITRPVTAAPFPETVDVILTDGTAVAGSDFTAGPITVSFAVGEISKTVPIELSTRSQINCC
jgi:hypothetical protein